MASASCLKLILYAAILMALLSLAGIITLGVVWQKKLSPFKDYSLIIDAGSTHSKIFVYTWPADKSDGLGTTSRISQVTSCDVPGGAITTVTNPSVDAVKEYFDAAMRNCTDQIPSTRKGRALIFLAGTAGLRLFEMTNATYTDELLNSTRAYFGSLGLLFKSPDYQVRIISGTEEGLSGWTSTNMLTRQLLSSSTPPETYGVSDLGGASTQITFYSPNATEDRYTLELFKQQYDLYSHSFLCYGIEQVRLVYLGKLVQAANASLEIADPCLQSGYNLTRSYDDIFGTPCANGSYIPSKDFDPSANFSFIGTGNSSACAAAVIARFNTSVCTTASCSFNDVYQPRPIPSSLKFFGISNGWFATFDSLAPNVSISKNAEGNYDFDNVTLADINKAINATCDQPWSELNTTNKYRPFLCFNAMYQWKLFEHGYAMNDDNLKNFHVVEKIDSSEIGWTLGYMINQTNGLDAQSRPERLISKSEFGGLLFLCILCLIVFTIVAVTAFRSYRGRRGFSET